MRKTTTTTTSLKLFIFHWGGKDLMHVSNVPEEFNSRLVHAEERISKIKNGLLKNCIQMKKKVKKSEEA